jgi:maltose O-acetyltransferase
MISGLLQRHAIYWRAMVSSVLAWPVVPAGMRRAVLHRISVRVDPTARIYAGSAIGGAGLEVGARVFINSGCTVHAVDRVILEDDVHLAPGVRIATTSHEIGDGARRAGPGTTAPVRVGAGSWIGAGAIVLPGVTIGPGCVIAAGAVVTRDCPRDGLYGGVPATRLRSLS